MMVSGSFTVASPLLNVNGDITADVQSFAFFDGRSHLTNLNAIPTQFIVLTENGKILRWGISVSTIFALALGDQSFAIRTSTFFDSGLIIECVAAAGGECTTISQDSANTELLNGRLSGNWSGPQDAIATPLPATFPLFATGLGVLGLLGWRRKRKAARVTPPVAERDHTTPAL
jgi:hypothetical protein